MRRWNGKEKGAGNREKSNRRREIGVNISLNHKYSIEISYRKDQLVHVKCRKIFLWTQLCFWGVTFICPCLY